MKNWRIVSTFFALWLTVQFASMVENMLAYAIVFTVGLIHGANDIQLIQKRDAFASSSFYRVLVLYILLVLSVALLFYYIPAISLIIFVILSAYHFGEEHWGIDTKDSTMLDTAFYIAYGLVILFSLFFFNTDETSVIIQELTNYSLTLSFFGWGFLISTVLYILLYIKSFLTGHVRKNVIEELFLLLVLFVVFKMATLLWGFAIYFVIWHSLPSIQNQIIYLFGRVTLGSTVKYLKSSLLYWLVSLIGLTILFFFFGNNDFLFQTVVFAFIAAITFPHVWVIRSIKSPSKGKSVY